MGKEIVMGIILMVLAVAVSILVLMQSGKEKSLSGTIAGAGESFFSKNKARSYDAFLARATKWFAVGFVVIVLALNVIAFFAKPAETTDEVSSDTALSETVDSASTDSVAATADEK